jgi:hypothetical protein
MYVSRMGTSEWPTWKIIWRIDSFSVIILCRFATEPARSTFLVASSAANPSQDAANRFIEFEINYFNINTTTWHFASNSTWQMTRTSSTIITLLHKVDIRLVHVLLSMMRYLESRTNDYSVVNSLTWVNSRLTRNRSARHWQSGKR